METENSYYLVTEMCGGGDLMSRICSRKRLDELETRRYIRQIVSAVDYLHKAGIIHRYDILILPVRLSVCLLCLSLSILATTAHNVCWLVSARMSELGFTNTLTVERFLHNTYCTRNIGFVSHEHIILSDLLC